MNDDDIAKILEEHKEELEALRNMRDEDIDVSDIPEITEEQWKRARRGPIFRPRKDQVTLRIDADILDWFRRHEDQYQTAINAALREHVQRRTAKARKTA